MGNDAYALTHMSILDIPVEVDGTRSTSDYDIYWDSSAQKFARIASSAASPTELAYLDITTLGTGAASKAVVLDSGEDYIWPASGQLTYGGTAITATGAELNILDGVTATTAEINNACDVSTRLISIADGTNTLSLTQATHANRIVSVLDATLAITLPEATGTGDSYTILQAIAATNSTIVTADTANAGFHGFIMGSDTDAAGNYNWVATGAEDTITYNGTSTGGKLWDWVRVTDVGTDAWLLEGNIKQSGGSEATPLSSAA